MGSRDSRGSRGGCADQSTVVGNAPSGSYTLQLGTVDVDRVPNAGNLAYPLGAPIAGTFSAGNVLALSFIPRLRLSGYFGLNGRYSILHTAAEQYTLGRRSDDNGRVERGSDGTVRCGCRDGTTDRNRILIFDGDWAGREPWAHSVRGVVQPPRDHRRERRPGDQVVSRSGRVAGVLSALGSSRPCESSGPRIAARYRRLLDRLAARRAATGGARASRLEQLASMSATHVALRIATEHARDLRHARIAARHRDVRRRHPAARTLAHDDVMVRPRRNLRQMSDREHLVIRRDAPHRLADL